MKIYTIQIYFDLSRFKIDFSDWRLEILKEFVSQKKKLNKKIEKNIHTESCLKIYQGIVVILKI